MDESPLVFIERWTRSLRALESKLESPTSDPVAALKELQDLGKELTERSVELPSYEVGRCERELKKVLTKANEKKSKSTSKAKFSFKRPTRAASDDCADTHGPPKAPIASGSRFDPTPISIPSTSLTLSSRTNEYLSFDSLPSTDCSHQEALLLQDLSNCFVELIPPSNQSFSSADDASKASFPAVYLSGLKACTVLLPTIQGSVMVHECEECELVLGGHQFRMHDSKRCRIYLDTSSTPIIERCRDLVFDGYPTLFNSSSQSLATEAKPPTSFVQDFDDPFATIQKPSPNWRFANEDDRAEWTVSSSEEVAKMWSSREGRKTLWERKNLR
ncbi:hypothetical protein JCM3765_006780 [Sporobolomyces pararoseus]